MSAIALHFYLMARIRLLGVWFCMDCEESKKKNYEEKVHKVIESEKQDILTLIGKIAITKALAASQFVYILPSTTSCSKSLKETTNVLFKFLWDNMGGKIKRTEMIADYTKMNDKRC